MGRFRYLCSYDECNAKKIALITGANKGLGFEMARQLGQAGVRVLLRDPQKGEAAAAKLRGERLDVEFLRLDVTDTRDHATASAFLEEKFGRLDILINNAGISAEALGTEKVSTTTEDAIHRTLDTNLLCAGGVDAGGATAAQEERCGTDCEYVEYSRLTNAACRSEEPYLRFQIALL